MTPNELAAFRAGIRWSAEQATIAGLMLEIRSDAHHLRQRAAIAALQSLAEGLRDAARTSVSAAVLNETIANAITSTELENARA